MTAVLDVARREFYARVRSKVFIIGIVASTIGIVALAVVPSFFDDDGDDFTVALVGAESRVLEPTLEQLGKQGDVTLDVRTDQSEREARADLANDELDAALVGTELVSNGEVDQTLGALIGNAHQTTAIKANLRDAGLSPSQSQQALTVEPLTETVVGGDSQDDATRQGLALVLMLSLLLLLMTSAVGVAVGIVEEKGNRIVEILLVSLKPWQLLAGKLLAFGLLGIIQLAVFCTAGLGAAAAVGLTDDLPQGSGVIVAAVVGGYLLGFCFFASMAAALASLVSRQEEVNGALGPMSTLMMLAYFGSFLAMQDSDSLLAEVLSIIPPFSAMVMPIRVALGDAPAWQAALSVGLMVAVVLGTTLLGAKIYERSVLRTGAKVRLADVIRSQ